MVLDFEGIGLESGQEYEITKKEGAPVEGASQVGTFEQYHDRFATMVSHCFHTLRGSLNKTWHTLTSTLVRIYILIVVLRHITGLVFW